MQTEVHENAAVLIDWLLQQKHRQPTESERVTLALLHDELSAFLGDAPRKFLLTSHSECILVTLDEFLGAHQLSEQELVQVRALSVGRALHFGGGAAVKFTLRRAA